MPKYDEPLFLISVVAKTLDIHPQTLRQYEREGLITPDRTRGKIRLYSQRDLDKIKMILSLTKDMGVNLAGVDVIFKLKEQISQLQSVIEELKKELSCINCEAEDKINDIEQGGINFQIISEKRYHLVKAKSRELKIYKDNED